MKKNNQSKVRNDNLNPLQIIFLRAKELKSQGQNIIELGVGDPDSKTPVRVKVAAIDAIQNHCNYIPPSGSKDLKEAIVNSYKKKDCKVKLEEVIVSGGSRITIDKIFQVLLKAKGIVMVPAPYYPPFIGIIKAYLGEPYIVDTRDDNFKLTSELVKKHILNIKKAKKNLKILIINSPNNPTGIEYDKKELKKIADLAEKYNFYIVSDECYGNFSKNKNFSYRSIYAKVIVVDSCSKTYAMTGYRVGWGLMPKEIADQVNLKLSLHNSSFSSISERAAIAALRGEGVPDFKEQRKYILNWIKGLGLGSNNLGQAGFYVFVNVKQYYKKFKLNSSLEFAELVLEKVKVSVAQGSAFGNYDDFVRISYCVKMRVLKEALEKIGQFLNNKK